mmetsp:Transcript_11072/g.30949  ORF Transcript_11072/g.30949 Transcript_11072/m.30949 type:complete len:214 (+) Transcript_11072:995-1636(+)
MACSTSPTYDNTSCCLIGTSCLSSLSISVLNSLSPFRSLAIAASPSLTDPGAKLARMLFSSLSSVLDANRTRFETGPSDLLPGTRKSSEICSSSFWIRRIGLLSIGNAYRSRAFAFFTGSAESIPALAGSGDAPSEVRSVAAASDDTASFFSTSDVQSGDDTVPFFLAPDAPAEQTTRLETRGAALTWTEEDSVRACIVDIDRLPCVASRLYR